MIFSFDQITALLSSDPYLFLLPLSIVEGPIVTLACGVLISIGRLNPIVAFGVVIAGDLIGDAILYSLGRWGGARVLRFLRSHGRIAARVRDLEDQLSREVDRVLVIGKLTHTLGALVLLAAGMIRMPFARFMTAGLGSTLLKSFALLAAGYWIGSSYQLILDHSAYAFGILLLLGAAALWAVLFRRRTGMSVGANPAERRPHRCEHGVGPDDGAPDQGKATLEDAKTIKKTNTGRGEQGTLKSAASSALPPMRAA